jgi:4-diphosphocytidyl-2C-methyl-D-erythritol kinase
MSDDHEEEDKLKCVAECSHQMHWCEIGSPIAREQTEVLQQLQEILMANGAIPGRMSGHGVRSGSAKDSEASQAKSIVLLVISLRNSVV